MDVAGALCSLDMAGALCSVAGARALCMWLVYERVRKIPCLRHVLRLQGSEVAERG